MSQLRFVSVGLVSAAWVALSAAMAIAQPSSSVPASQPTSSAQSVPSPSGLEILERAAQHYADAKSYYLESVEERNSSSEYMRNWNKTVLIAAEAPGGKYYYEGRSNMGGGLKVADGQTVWTYRAGEHRYTAKPESSENVGKQKPAPMQEGPILQAKNLRRMLADWADSVKSADRLPDETLLVEGKPVLCQMVHVTSADLKRSRPSNRLERTIWIDREHNTVLKMVERGQSTMLMGPASIPEEVEMTTWYAHTVLDGPLRDSLFTFNPPSDAHLIADFPDQTGSMGASMAGDPAPPLKLKSADGKVVPLESFRGHPVLLDFWATWCGPCVVMLPQISKIYQEGKDKGLVLLGVDQDEDATAAAGFLAKKGYAWSNFHDGDGEIEKLMGATPLPRVVLVDAQGQIVYDGTGMNEKQLRTHIVQLGPEFAEMAPKPEPAPCAATK
ncbi:MAG: TlpA disulfide reductase family protein [Terracidiphilus sp.]|nr:TlpA disulfide reductase family protein [Terracidiphilus sp.]